MLQILKIERIVNFNERVNFSPYFHLFLVIWSFDFLMFKN